MNRCLAPCLSVWLLGGCTNIVPRGDMAQCAGVQTPALRLTCYDNLATHLGVGHPENRNVSQRGWHMRTERSPIDGSLNVYLSTPSDRGFVTSSGQSMLPSLNIRCKENTTALIVGYGTRLGDGRTQVAYRIDAQPLSRETWRLSMAGDAVGLWTGNASIPFLKRLFDAEHLQLGVTPPGGDSVTSMFEVAGLAQAIEPLRTACHW
ncbi:MAG: type VI secretion system-associated protein TagO [Gammaproteobacteria bacterium]